MIYLNNNVSTKVIISCLKYAKNKNINLEDIVKKHKYSYETINDTYNWVSQEFFLDIVKSIESKIVQKKIAYEIGLNSYDSWGELTNVFKAIGNIKTIIFQFDKFYSYFFKNKTYSIVSKDENSIQIVHKPVDLFETHAFNFVLASLYSLPRLWGGEELTISKLSSQEYRISLEQAPCLFSINNTVSNYSPRLIEDIIFSLEKSNSLVEEKNKKLQDAYEKLKNSFNEKLISEKMATLGFLSAGIAHEINNPLSFIISNVRTINKYFEELTKVIDISKLKINDQKQSEIEEIFKQIPQIFDETNTGLERVKKLVTDINYLAHPGTKTYIGCDLSKIIDSAITLTKNLHKNLIKIVTIYKHTKTIECIPSSISQVIVNMIINSIQSIKELKTSDGLISISTHEDDKNVYITIKDNGKGVEAKSKDNIFEPFFTTKNVGKGTGLGLSTSLSIIKNHGGNISLKSAESGASFVIYIPLKQDIEEKLLFENKTKKT